jgi:hypothetical protein
MALVLLILTAGPLQIIPAPVALTKMTYATWIATIVIAVAVGGAFFALGLFLADKLRLAPLLPLVSFAVIGWTVVAPTSGWYSWRGALVLGASCGLLSSSQTAAILWDLYRIGRPLRMWANNRPEAAVTISSVIALEELAELPSNPDVETLRSTLVLLEVCRVLVERAVSSRASASQRDASWLKSEARRRAWIFRLATRQMLLDSNDVDAASDACRSSLNASLRHNWLLLAPIEPNEDPPRVWFATARSIVVGCLPLALTLVATAFGWEGPTWITKTAALWAVAGLVGAADPFFKERYEVFDHLRQLGPTT